MPALYDRYFDRNSNLLQVFIGYLIGRVRRGLDPGCRIKQVETQGGRSYRCTQGVSQQC